MDTSLDKTPAFYTPKEVAAILRFKKADQVYALCHSRVIPSFQLGRNWLIPKEQFHEWLNEQLVASSSPKYSFTF
ncbi:helix-turn-helix domain-containing protein [Phascolarctobacterium sp.]|uniref:helix-turn-helix domain-containing protein n=1 Tax=Phascolarctobacterium sp. TaxID=2049039 RepID=UPI0034C6C70B